MRRSLLLAAAAAALTGAIAVGAASAGPLPNLAPGVTHQTLLQEAQYRGRYRGYCRRWRAECARRWGVGGWRYRRCLSARGCI